MLLNEMGSSGRLRYEALLAEAEEYRLQKRATMLPANQATMIGQVRYWLGMQLVQWGHQLKGYGLTALPQLPEHELHNRSV